MRTTLAESPQAIAATVSAKNSPLEPSRRQKQLARLLERLKAGERYTVGRALAELRIYALSQRCGDLRVMGWDIKDRWINTADGQCKEYFMEKSA